MLPQYPRNDQYAINDKGFGQMMGVGYDGRGGNIGNCQAKARSRDLWVGKGSLNSAHLEINTVALEVSPGCFQGHGVHIHGDYSLRTQLGGRYR